MMADHEFDIEEDEEIEQLRNRHHKIQLLKQAFQYAPPQVVSKQTKENIRKTVTKPIPPRKRMTLQESNYDITDSKSAKSRKSVKESQVSSRKDLKKTKEVKQPAQTYDVVQRLYAKEQTRQETLLRKQEQQIKQEIKSTKPKPDISKRSKEIAKSKGSLIMLDTKSNIGKRKDLSPLLKADPSRANSVKSVMRNDYRNEEFIKSQQEWLVHRNANLLKQRIELKSKELDGCTPKPQISKRSKEITTKSRIKEQDSMKCSQTTSRLMESQFISRVRDNIDITL